MAALWPMLLPFASGSMKMPSPELPRSTRTFPAGSKLAPMLLFCTSFRVAPAPKNVMPFPALPPMRLRKSKGVFGANNSPMEFWPPKTRMPSPSLPSLAVPARLTPIMFASTVAAPLPSTMPFPAFPLMRFRERVLVIGAPKSRPMFTWVLRITTPLPPLPRSRLPVLSVPMKLPYRIVPFSASSTRTPSPPLPEIRFAYAFGFATEEPINVPYGPSPAFAGTS